MTELVASARFEAVTTADPEEVLQLVRSGRSRSILADVHMPGMDGYEFGRPTCRTSYPGDRGQGGAMIGGRCLWTR